MTQRIREIYEFPYTIIMDTITDEIGEVVAEFSWDNGFCKTWLGSYNITRGFWINAYREHVYQFLERAFADLLGIPVYTCKSKEQEYIEAFEEHTQAYATSVRQLQLISETRVHLNNQTMALSENLRGFFCYDEAMNRLARASERVYAALRFIQPTWGLQVIFEQEARDLYRDLWDQCYGH